MIIMNTLSHTRFSLFAIAFWLCTFRPCLLLTDSSLVLEYTKTCTDNTLGAQVSAFHDTLTQIPADHLDFANGIDVDATCNVVKNDCIVNMTSDDAPGEPKGLRLSQLLSTDPAKSDPYQLTVNVTWRAAYYQTSKTRGFQVTVIDRERNSRMCFTYLFGKNYTLPAYYYHTPWFTFTISSWFEFGRKYAVIVQSLPKTIKPPPGTNLKSPYVPNARSMTFNSPEHPSSPNADVENCSFAAHSDAGTWIGAFSSVLVLPWAKKLVAVFIAAPPKYCFEAYRVRLLKMHMISEEAIVYASDLHAEIVGNTTVLFGNHTFENVDYGVYSLLLLPQDRSSKYRNRCLCPLPTKMCVCSPAEWSDIDFQDPAVAPVNPCDESTGAVGDPFICRNGTEVSASNVAKTGGSTFDLVNSGWIIVALLAGIAFSVATAACILRFAYKKYGKTDMILYTIPLRHNNNGADDNDESSLVVGAGHQNGRLLVAESKVDARQLDVLVIFSNDDRYHAKAIESLINLALYELGDDKFKFRAHFSCKSEIAENKVDWINRNLYDSDKILLINSYGAFIRYEAKMVNSPSARHPAANYSEENVDDDLFLPMLDLLAENLLRYTTSSSEINKNLAAKLATVQFVYTPAEFALRHAALGSAGRRFRVPEHLDQLLGWLQYDVVKCRGGDRRRMSDCVTVDKTSAVYSELCRAIENVERNCLLPSTTCELFLNSEHKDGVAKYVKSVESSPQHRQMARTTDGTTTSPSVHLTVGPATNIDPSVAIDGRRASSSLSTSSSSSDENLLRPLLLLCAVADDDDDAAQRRRNSSPPANAHHQSTADAARSSDVAAGGGCDRRWPSRRPSLSAAEDATTTIGDSKNVGGDGKTVTVVGDSADSGICCDMPSTDNCASGKSPPKKRSLDEASSRVSVLHQPPSLIIT